MDNRNVHPRVKKALGVNTDIELFLKLVIENGKFIHDFYTINYMGRKFDNIRNKFFLLDLVDKFQNHSSYEVDKSIARSFKEHNSGYQKLIECINKEYEQVEIDFNNFSLKHKIPDYPINRSQSKE